MQVRRKRWVDWIYEAMMNLGGSASYTELYEEIQKIHPGPLTKSWKATVRRTIETYSSDSDNYRENNPDLFCSVGGIGSGYWGLRRRS